ncbi:MAG: O-antigen ligase family protein [Oscillospiraceae bacterium]|nr:O-antigen ligase family protein [Oscillospiraceae bacterium]
MPKKTQKNLTGKRAGILARQYASADKKKLFASGCYIIFVFAIHPLVVNLIPNTEGLGYAYYNITLMKLISFAVSLGVLAFFSGVLALERRALAGTHTRKGLKEHHLRIKPYEWALLAYLLIMLISALRALSLPGGDDFSPFTGTTMRNEGFFMWAGYICAFFLVSRLSKPQFSHFIALGGTSVLVSGYAILQYYGLDPLSLKVGSALGVNGPKMLYFSTMSNRNVFSSYLCLILPALIVMLCRGKRLSRFWILPMIWLNIYAILLGNTEGGYIALLAAVFFAIPFIVGGFSSAGRLLLAASGLPLLMLLRRAVHWEEWGNPPYTRLTGLCLVCGIVFVVLGLGLIFLSMQKNKPEGKEFYFLTKKPFIIGWMLMPIVFSAVLWVALPSLAEKSQGKTTQELYELSRGVLSDSAGSNRGFIWKSALSVLPERLLIGYGPDGLHRVFNERFNDEAKERFGVVFDKAHNEYLQVLVDSGILGLACLLVFYGLLLWRATRHLCKTNNGLALAAWSAGFCFLIQAFFNISTPFANPIAWVMWGVLAALTESTSFDASKS